MDGDGGEGGVGDVGKVACGVCGAGWAGAGEEVAGLEVGEAGGGAGCGVDVGDC